MSLFIHENFLLQAKTARHLYHQYAADMPIIDYHSHLEAEKIYNNYQYGSISEAWLSEDHYMWRALRSNGVDESFITGDASDYEKFQKWCEIMPYLIGNPIYHWCHLELKKYFGIDLLINPENCDQIWQKCYALLQSPSYGFRQLLQNNRVEVLCTTDDPLSDLKYHRQLAQSDFKTKILPTFRADGLFAIHKNEEFPQLIKELGYLTGVSIQLFDDYVLAIEKRMDFFAENGCKLSDLGMPDVDFAQYSREDIDRIFSKATANEALNSKEIAQFKTALFKALGHAYHRRGWSMQLHIGVLSDVNERRLKAIGSCTGFSVMKDHPIGDNLCKLLNVLDKDRKLPQTILYSLNPKDNATLGSILGAFQDSDSSAGKIQLGCAWWFNDHKLGMEKQLEDLANLGAFGRFIGMLTDSRSIFSLSRHDYFRRILCNLLARWVDQGEIPNDEQLLKKTIENICLNNAKQYFKFNH